MISLKILNIISRVETFMRLTYPHILKLGLNRLNSMKNINFEILTIFYSHIMRIFYKFICSFHLLQSYEFKMWFLFNIYLK